MTMSVLGLLTPSGGAVYYTPEWRKLVEDHLQWLRRSAEMDVVIIDDHLGYKYRGDFDGALLELGVPPERHWVALRVNGMTNPTEFDGNRGTVMIPTTETLNRLFQVYRSLAK